MLFSLMHRITTRLVNLNEKLEKWVEFYYFNRPHGAFKGKKPHETLMSHLKNELLVNIILKFYSKAKFWEI